MKLHALIWTRLQARNLDTTCHACAVLFAKFILLLCCNSSTTHVAAHCVGIRDGGCCTGATKRNKGAASDRGNEGFLPWVSNWKSRRGTGGAEVGGMQTMKYQWAMLGLKVGRTPPWTSARMGSQRCCDRLRPAGPRRSTPKPSMCYIMRDLNAVGWGAGWPDMSALAMTSCLGLTRGSVRRGFVRLHRSAANTCIRIRISNDLCCIPMHVWAVG